MLIIKECISKITKSNMPTILSNDSELCNISFILINLERIQNQDFVLSFFELVTGSTISYFMS